MRIPRVIRIKKRSLSGWLIWLVVLMPFGFAFFQELLGLPNGVKYLLDLAWLGLGVLLIRGRRKLPTELLRWVGTFVLLTLVVYLFRWQSGFYYLWGFRNNFRFYAVFFAVCAFLRQGEGEAFLRKLDGLFRLNVAVSLYQYFVLGKSGDYLGGIFGTVQGCNAYTNLFFCVVVTRSLVRFLEKQEHWRSCLGKCFWALLLAALAELKFFFLEFGVIAVLAAAMSGFSWRKLWTLLGATAGVVVGAALLAVLFPNFSGWFSVQWILDAAGGDRGYTSSGDLNRLNSIAKINQWFFTSFAQRLFGLGLGNCDTSAFAFLDTPFYRAFSRIHYSWMSVSFWYLEGGFLGLVFFFGFFVLLFRAAGRMERYRKGEGKLHCRMVRILAAVCCLVGVYNASLRTEAAYMVYFVLALPFSGQGWKGEKR